jgi:hypothetical protein
LFYSEICKYTHFFTFNLTVTKEPWVMEKTTYIFEFNVKSTIRITYFSSWNKKKVKFCWPVLLQYTHERKFICSRKKSLAFPVPMFTELTNSQHQCVLTSLTENHPNTVIKVKSTDRNPLTPLNKVRLSLLLFSRNSHVLKFLLTSLLPIFFPFRPKNVGESQNFTSFGCSMIFAVAIFTKLPFAQQ